MAQDIKHRELARVVTLPPLKPGQFGPDHRVVEVITADQWRSADPFILLMDDRIDGKLIGGPHPHAGFETVTFLVDGHLHAEGGSGRLAPGDVEWTTTGSGIVHGSSAPIEGRLRVLQLWVTLPRSDRWTEPDNQLVPAAGAPLRQAPGAEVRLYSGRSGTLRSPTRNRVPITLADIRLQPGAAIDQAVSLSHNGFLYPLRGEARIGAEATPLRTGQIGWLDRPAQSGEQAGEQGGEQDGEQDSEGTLLIANAGPEPLRILFYSGQRQDVPIVSHGPFIGDSRQDIIQAFDRYRAGTFRRY